MRQIKWIVQHTTGGTQNQSTASIQAHWKSLGWKRPGYHHLIDADGTDNNLVPIWQISNGVAGFNEYAIHISYKGGVVNKRIVDNRTPQQKATMEALVRKYKAMFPDATILGHRDFSPDKNRNGIIEPHEWKKACPSFSVAEWLQEIGLVKTPTMPVVKKAIATMKGGNVNVRETPGLESAIIGKVATNDICILLGQSNGWSNVQFSDKLTGWVRADFLK